MIVLPIRLGRLGNSSLGPKQVAHLARKQSGQLRNFNGPSGLEWTGLALPISSSTRTLDSLRRNMHGRPRKPPKPNPKPEEEEEDAAASVSDAANLRALQSHLLHAHPNSM